MTDLGRSLRALPIEWPATPDFAARVQLAPRRRRYVVVAVAFAAVAAAFAVPDSRSTILRFFHLGGVTVEHVAALTPAEELPLAAGLGDPIGDEAAHSLLGTSFLPVRHGQLYSDGGFVSTIIGKPNPLLLSEFGSAGLVKKFTTGTVEYVQVSTDVSGLWIPGGHNVFFGGASPRLAGNVLVWTSGDVTFRLEGHDLSRSSAIRLASEILEGTSHG